MNFLQQPETVPHEARGHPLSVRLAVQHRLSRLADASSQRVVAEAHLHLRLIAVCGLAEHLRQAVFAVVPVAPARLCALLLRRAPVNIIAPADAVQLRHPVMAHRRQLTAFQRVARCVPAPPLQPRPVLHQQPSAAVVLPARAVKRIVVPLFAYRVVAPVVIPPARPAPRSRTPRITGEHVPPAHAAQAVIRRAAGQQPLGAADLAVQLVTGKIADRQAVERNTQQVAAAVIQQFKAGPDNS